MRPHVSAETLARYRQGDLSPRRVSRIGAHLGECARCSELNEDLGGVTTLLASVNPPPIPHDLTARIQSALASEAAKRVAVPAGSKTAPAPAGGGAAGPASPAGTRGPRGRFAPGGPRRRGLLARLPNASPKFALTAVAATAAVVVLGVGMYQIVQSGSSRSSGTAASSSAGKPASGNPATRGPVLQYRRSGQQTSVTPVSADTNFTAGRLTAQVAAAMTKYGSDGIIAGPMTGSATRSNPQAAAPHATTFGNRVVSALQGCVNRIAAGDLVVLVELARFQGSPATIIVTEVPDITPRQVWVVGPGCSASRSDVLRHSELSVG